MDDELSQAAQEGDVERVRAALEKERDPLLAASVALRWAARANQVEMVSYLIPRSMPAFEDSRALCWAAGAGSLESVRALIPVSGPKGSISCALAWAARLGRLDCLAELLPLSDPKAGSSEALRSAALGGHIECVLLLLPVSDVKAGWLDGLDAKSVARNRLHYEIAELIGSWESSAEEKKELSDELVAASASISSPKRGL